MKVYWLFCFVLYSIIFFLQIPMKKKILFAFGKKGSLLLKSNTRKVKVLFLFNVFYSSFFIKGGFLGLRFVSLLSRKSGHGSQIKLATPLFSQTMVLISWE